MTATVFDEGNSLTSIVNGVDALGIAVSEPVLGETRLYQRLRSARKTAETAYEDALSRLRLAPLEDFDTAQEDLIAASLSMSAISQGVDRALLRASTHRLQAAVYDSLHTWEAEIVERFNEVVSQYNLNELAGHLPNFSDPASINVLSLTQAQGAAIDAWRAAVNELRPLWRLYRHMARFNGHTIGPADVNDLSANLFTACVLGNPGSFGRADTAATIMASAVFGSDATTRYAQLLPFVIPTMSGYDLHLSTADDASAIRRSIQPGS
ncbi:hypothetical protein [Mycolicibacterium smegmatis]|uniref:Uncharacterized protein n=1 Tax=Mycolicibacterium smegmatis (strain MKD8) TaxID=1214915 RepID=A0A2U9PLL5_MYCSE|nr:hypothetical protein [Mycolicibacterium smegmatis]AWT52586.1 hypothetical protein D806_016020 [Mycolicibacterium smegmatis MKD8]